MYGENAQICFWTQQMFIPGPVQTQRDQVHYNESQLQVTMFEYIHPKAPVLDDPMLVIDNVGMIIRHDEQWMEMW